MHISVSAVFGSHPDKFHDICEKLMPCVPVPGAMRKLNEKKSYVRNTLEIH